MKAPGSIPPAGERLRDAIGPRQVRRGLALGLARAAACVYGLPVADVLSAKRDARTVRARHAAMYLAREMTPLSLPQIGRMIGGRDHTSALHACRRIGALAAADWAVERELMRIAETALAARGET